MSTITKTVESIREQLAEFGNSVAEFSNNAASSVASAASNAATTAAEGARERVLELNRFAATNVERLSDWLPNADVRVPDVSDSVIRMFDVQRQMLDANQKLAEDVLKIWKGAPKAAAPKAVASKPATAKPAARKAAARRAN